MALAALQAVTVTSQSTPCSSFVPWCSSHEWVMEELAGEGRLPVCDALGTKSGNVRGYPNAGSLQGVPALESGLRLLTS